MSFQSSSSVKDVEFAYQTRLVVYKFLGLLPTQSIAEDESQADESNDRKPENIPWELSSLPQVSLIEKLKDSEDLYAKNKSICDELVRKVERVSSVSPKSEKRRSRIIYASQKLYPEELHNCLLREIRLKGNADASSSDEGLQQMTLIKKKKNVKVIVESTKQQHESFELSPISNLNIVQMDGPVDRSSEKVSSSEDDPDLEEILRDPSSVEGSRQNFSFQESPFAAMHQSLGRQMSSLSSGSRKYRTYVDVNDVDDNTLKSFKTISKAALPLKREISKALSLLESDFNSQMQSMQQSSENHELQYSRPPGTSGQFSDSSAVSQVADRLRAIGDKLNEREPSIEDALDLLLQRCYVYEDYFQAAFREAARVLLEGIDSGWSRVAMMLVIGQRLLMRLFESGSNQISAVAEMTAVSLEQQLGSFIVDNGGWNGVAVLDLLEQPLCPESDEMLNLHGCKTEASSELEREKETNGDGGGGDDDNIVGIPHHGRDDCDSRSSETPHASTNTPGYESAPRLEGNARKDPSRGFSKTDLVDNKNKNAESPSDFGGRSSSQELLSTPTDGSSSPCEAATESPDEGLPENSSNSFGDELKVDEGKKASHSTTRETPSLEGHPEQSTFGSMFIRVSVVLGALVVLWRLLKRRR